MEYATVWQRFLATVLDNIILTAVFWLIFILLVFIPLNTAIKAAIFILLFLFEDIFYFTLLEAKYSRTIGKIALNIKVVSENNKKINFKQALIRNITKSMPFFDFIFRIIGFFLIIYTKKHQRIGDMMAKTIVVKG